MRYRFHTVDVFTEVRFGGNPLAVLPDARGLSDAQMQQIAAEFGYSESAFVLPPANPSNTRRVRIFTPRCELPFAGHPNVGTAFVLASEGYVATQEETLQLRFEEIAGTVPVTVTFDAGRPKTCVLAAPKPLELGTTFEPAAAAHALSLSETDLSLDNHAPLVASVGVPFVMIAVKDARALARATASAASLQAVFGAVAEVHIYTLNPSTSGVDIQARMYAPGMGIEEDPATGSANCALAGLLAHCGQDDDDDYKFRVAQGIEMGRPSLMQADADKRAGKIVETRIGGCSTAVTEGSISL